jgi:hypothetical protein
MWKNYLRFINHWKGIISTKFYDINPGWWKQIFLQLINLGGRRNLIKKKETDFLYFKINFNLLDIPLGKRN